MPIRIYADFNGYGKDAEDASVELDTLGTLIDLHYYRVRLVEGLQITIWDQSDSEEELEVTGVCRYHRKIHRPVWCLHFPPDALKYVPYYEDSVLARIFLCFQCRSPIPDSSRAVENPVCPTCGLSLHYPWQAP